MCPSDDLPSSDVAEAAAFFEMSLDHLCVIGFDGYFRRVSPSWTKTLGWTPEELMSRPSIELVHPDDRAAVSAARQTLRSGVPLMALVNRYRCRDGTYRWFAWRSVADLDRAVVYAAARDVTDEKQLKEQLIVSERMASLGTLAAGAGHEINNPLAYVTMNLDMLLEQIRASTGALAPANVAEWGEMAAEAREGTQRISNIVRALMTFSAPGGERREAIEVNPVIELSIGLASMEIKQRARLVRDYGELPRVEADDGRLVEVFVNLLVNAAQAFPEGDAEANEIRIVTSTDATGRAVIEVRDTGTGIPASLVGRIFDPFFTTKPIGVGSGLGLSVCHNIVASLGGTIAVTSIEGRGTTFRVVLPAAS